MRSLSRSGRGSHGVRIGCLLGSEAGHPHTAPAVFRDVGSRRRRKEPGMAVDPTDPETFVEDEEVHEDEEFDVEAPEVDAAEQQRR
ncbi:hypothetical protein GCM10023238_38480 [Streptomyces heliomycini]